MAKDVNQDGEPHLDIDERIRRGAEQGGELTRQKFAEQITRNRFCEEVGIHRNTLKKWESQGIVTPTFVEILRSRTAVFEPSDVERGKRIARLIADNVGTMSIRRAAAIADGKNG